MTSAEVRQPSRLMAGTATATLVLGLVTATVAPAAAGTVAAQDDFDGGTYGGGTGWQGPWSEIGESDGPETGSVQVGSDGTCAGGECLVLANLVAIGDIGAIGAQRRLDLTDATEAHIDYHLETQGLVSGLEVEAWNGRSWQAVGGNQGELPVGTVVTIRVRASGLSALSAAGFDNAVVTITSTDPTTTTTTTTTSLVTITSIPIPTVTVTTPPLTPSTLTTTSSTIGGDTTTTDVPRRTADTPSENDDERTTTTTRPGDVEGETSTTSDLPEDTDGSRTTTTVTPPNDPPVSAIDEPGGRPPSPTSGVVTDVDPGLTPRLGRGEHPDRAQTGLLVRFRILAESIDLDLLSNAALGVVLAAVSFKGLDSRGG